jgi:hypothetical protein
VYIPVVVALIAAGAAIAATLVGTKDGAPPPPDSPEAIRTLQLIDTVVANKPPRTRSGSADDVNKGIGGEYDATEAAGVVLTLRNSSRAVSVINRARLVIADFDALGAEGCIPGAGPVAISANYHAQLPVRATPGQAIDVRLSQELRPNTADRIRLGFALDNPSPTEVFDNGDGTGASRLYVLRIELFHDGLDAPLKTRPVLLAVPFPWYGLFLRNPHGVPGDCIAQNRATLEGMLKLEAESSPELAAFAERPEDEACARQDPYCPELTP